MHRYADGGVTEDYSTDGVDVLAEADRIEAEAEARAAAKPDDWEPLP